MTFKSITKQGLYLQLGNYINQINRDNWTKVRYTLQPSRDVEIDECLLDVPPKNNFRGWKSEM